MGKKENKTLNAGAKEYFREQGTPKSKKKFYGTREHKENVVGNKGTWIPPPREALILHQNLLPRLEKNFVYFEDFQSTINAKRSVKMSRLYMLFYNSSSANADPASNHF